MSNKLTVGISPCPNDTFMFDAIINKKIDTKGLDIDFYLLDVEELNKKAFNNELDITKLSYFTYAQILDDYILLNSGSALGFNCGPLLISKNKFDNDFINQIRIAIPGKNTTANFLLSYAFPKTHNKVDYLFSNIETAVVNEDVDAGVIIHENRFTFESKGLIKIMDLGEYWQGATGFPIPLGAIVIKRDIPEEIKVQFDTLLKESIQFAMDNPESSKEFIKQHAQEMEDDVIQKHIDLYVNEFSLDLGLEGKKAVNKLINVTKDLGMIKNQPEKIIVEV